MGRAIGPLSLRPCLTPTAARPAEHPPRLGLVQERRQGLPFRFCWRFVVHPSLVQLTGTRRMAIRRIRNHTNSESCVHIDDGQFHYDHKTEKSRRTRGIGIRIDRKIRNASGDLEACGLTLESRPVRQPSPNFRDDVRFQTLAAVRSLSPLSLDQHASRDMAK